MPDDYTFYSVLDMVIYTFNINEFELINNNDQDIFEWKIGVNSPYSDYIHA